MVSPENVPVGETVPPAPGQVRKSFCFFFQKEVLF
jgi:hypothetical protein